MISPNAEFAKIVFTDNRQFKVLFDDYLTLAFDAWGITCPEIAEKYESNQYEALATDIQQLMDNICKKQGNGPISFLSTSEHKILSATNWNDAGWTTIGTTSTEEYVLFLIGEIFIQIQWLWHLIPAQDKCASRTDTLAIHTRSCALGQLSTELAKRISLVKSGKNGGEKTNPIRERCKAIIQSPEYNITATDAGKRMPAIVQKLKNIYHSKYDEFPQRKLKNGKIVKFSDKTLANWIFDFT